MSTERFSKRYGHAEQEEVEITIRDDAPEHVREGIFTLAESDLDLSPSFIRDVLCKILRKLPDRNNWSQYPNIYYECQGLIEGCPWYKVYDFVEALYESLQKTSSPERAETWEKLINEYFLETGVGWRLVGGQLESRGPESFKVSVDTARQSLEEAELPTARSEMHEALRDLSRRPEPDLTGAIHHAIAALECTARKCMGDPRATLGELLKTFPDLFPKPLDTALEKLWGYASEMARHIREGRTPKYAEAELVVGVAASACTYLAVKIQEQNQK